MKNIAQTIEENGKYRHLLTALEETKLFDTLSTKGPYTLYAPIDDAFHRLPPGVLDELMDDKDRLKEILAYHISAGKISSDELEKIGEADTLQGELITIIKEDSYLMIDNAKLIKGDIECSNGVIHLIDMVLMP